MIQIVPCRISHLRAVAADLREEERLECAIMCVKPRHMMHALWRRSLYSRAALCPKGVIAVWGDNAPVISQDGFMWLFTSSLVVGTAPIAFFREVERVVMDRLAVRDVIRTSALASSRRALRFWSMLGFMVGEPDDRGLCELRLGRGLTELEEAA